MQPLPVEALVESLVGAVRMRLLLILLLLVVLLGPLRRPLLRHARFTIPGIAGGMAGLAFGSFVAARAGVPAPLAALIALTAAAALGLSFGEACKEWFDRVFGPKE